MAGPPWCVDDLLNVNLHQPLPIQVLIKKKCMKATEAIEKMLEKETSNTEVI
jgi:hypothetical protein